MTRRRSCCRFCSTPVEYFGDICPGCGPDLEDDDAPRASSFVDLAAADLLKMLEGLDHELHHARAAIAVYRRTVARCAAEGAGSALLEALEADAVAAFRAEVRRLERIARQL